MRIIASLLLSAMLISGCLPADQPRNETERRIRVANQELAEWEAKIRPLLTPAVTREPELHIPQLFFVFEMIGEADKVYPSFDLYSPAPDSYRALREQVDNLTPTLNLAAKRVLQGIEQHIANYRLSLDLIDRARNQTGNDPDTLHLNHRFGQTYRDLQKDLNKVEIMLTQLQSLSPQLAELIHMANEQVMDIIMDDATFESFAERIRALPNT